MNTLTSGNGEDISTINALSPPYVGNQQRYEANTGHGLYCGGSAGGGNGVDINQGVVGVSQGGGVATMPPHYNSNSPGAMGSGAGLTGTQQQLLDTTSGGQHCGGNDPQRGGGQNNGVVGDPLNGYDSPTGGQPHGHNPHHHQSGGQLNHHHNPHQGGHLNSQQWGMHPSMGGINTSGGGHLNVSMSQTMAPHPHHIQTGGGGSIDSYGPHNTGGVIQSPCAADTAYNHGSISPNGGGGQMGGNSSPTAGQPIPFYPWMGVVGKE